MQRVERMVCLRGAMLILTGCGDPQSRDDGPAMLPVETGGEGSSSGGDGLDVSSSGESLPDPPSPVVDLSCGNESDCLSGEVCAAGVCQMPRCTGAFAPSVPPLGKSLAFRRDEEFLLAGVAGLGVVQPAVPGVSQAWPVVEPRDVAAGDFTGEGDVAAVAAVAGGLTIQEQEASLFLPLDFDPAGVAAVDFDDDGVAQVVAVGPNGEVGLCTVSTQGCSETRFEGATGLDVAAADLDGDGVEEAVFLLDLGGSRVLRRWSPTGQFEDVDLPVAAQTSRVDGGRLGGSGAEEVVTLGGGVVRVLGMGRNGAYVRAQLDIDGARDVAIGDADADQDAELFVLTGSEVLEFDDAAGLLVNDGQHTIEGDLGSLALGDFDGDSWVALLIHPEAALVPGRLTPIIVGYFPPYEAGVSTGSSSMLIGDGTSASAQEDYTISVSGKVSIGYSGDLSFLGSGVSASVSASISQKLAKTWGSSHAVSVSERVSAAALPQHEGTETGVVYLQCTCYHTFVYDLLVPGGEPFVTVMPVGGTVTAWSIERYNAMAMALGDMPIIEAPYTVGELASYPPGPQRANGDPVPEEDFVFPQVPSLVVSDIGAVGWSLSVSDSQTRSTSLSSDLSIEGDIGIEVGAQVADVGGSAKVTFGAGLGLGFSAGKSLTVGENATFLGSVPPILDDPATMADEYVDYGYAFSPYVYREHYVDPAGYDAAYYVMSYAVELPPGP